MTASVSSLDNVVYPFLLCSDLVYLQWRAVEERFDDPSREQQGVEDKECVLGHE